MNNLNQYTAVNGNATSFDTKGNLLSWTGGAFGYDAQNRLIGASRGTNGAIFLYDGRNRCVQRIINGNTTTFIYDGWDLIAEYSGTLPIAEYIHGPGTDETLARATAIGTDYYTGDALNSTAALTDGSGNVVEKYRYTAFGQPTVYDATGTNVLFESAYGNRFAFQGREWFAEINLTDHRNRYYSPELNRWLNRDPLGDDGSLAIMTAGLLTKPGSGKANALSDDEAFSLWSAINRNLYNFVDNNPVNEVDPLGLDPNTELAVAIARGDTEAIQSILDAVADDDVSAAMRKSAQDALNKLRSKAGDWISKQCKGGINREFPDQFRNDTLEDIKNAAKAGDKAAKKAWKLLNDSRFKK